MQLVLCVLAAVALGAEVREKRGLGWGQQEGWQAGWQPGWQAGWHQPKSKVIFVKKVVHVPREVTVPQVVHVRKLISEPKVVVVKKVVPVQHGHHGWW